MDKQGAIAALAIGHTVHNARFTAFAGRSVDPLCVRYYATPNHGATQWRSTAQDAIAALAAL